MIEPWFTVELPEGPLVVLDDGAGRLLAHDAAVLGRECTTTSWAAVEQDIRTLDARGQYALLERALLECPPAAWGLLYRNLRRIPRSQFEAVFGYPPPERPSALAVYVAARQFALAQQFPGCTVLAPGFGLDRFAWPLADWTVEDVREGLRARGILRAGMHRRDGPTPVHTYRTEQLSGNAARSAFGDHAPLDPIARRMIAFPLVLLEHVSQRECLPALAKGFSVLLGCTEAEARVLEVAVAPSLDWLLEHQRGRRLVLLGGQLPSLYGVETTPGAWLPWPPFGGVLSWPGKV